MESLVERQTRKKVKKLRTDNGLENCNQMFDSFYKIEEIVRHKTVKLTPQQNGIAERMNRTLMDKVRCMLVQAKLPMSFWAETLNTTRYLVNPSHFTIIDYKTSFEACYGKLASYGSLRVFRCQSYTHINQGKLALRAFKGIFSRYLYGVKGSKLWSTDLKSTISV